MNDELRNIAPIDKLTKYFANEASVEEILWVEKWCDSSQENLKEFNAIKKLWQITDKPSSFEPIDLELEWKKMDNAITPVKTIRFNPIQILAIAASIVLITFLSIVGLNRLHTTVDQTEIAQIKEIKLPDGSVINLNANSKISFKDEFGKDHRNIELTGEAFFNVSSNKEIPFIISANGASIEVVGTQFNVKAYKDQQEVKVTVSEGTVSLSESKSSNKQILINAGETGKFVKQNKTIEKIVTIDQNDIAWKTRIINFSDTPLSEVVSILSNTYHMNIQVNDNIKTCPITVSFSDLELSQVLHIIKSTFNLQINQIDNTIIISGPGCSPL